MGGITDDQLVALGHGPLDIAFLHQADLLLAGTNGDEHTVDHDLLGSGGNGHQPRGALAVERLATDRQRQTAGQYTHAPQVPAGRTGRHTCAHHQIVDFSGFDARTLDRGPNGKGGHGRRRGVVESTAERLGDRCAGGRENHGFFHVASPFVNSRPTPEDVGHQVQSFSMRDLPAATSRCRSGAGWNHISPYAPSSRR
ncbi:hypothetical protein D3C84_671030 [compost metagenome]